MQPDFSSLDPKDGPTGRLNSAFKRTLPQENADRYGLRAGRGGRRRASESSRGLEANGRGELGRTPLEYRPRSRSAEADSGAIRLEESERVPMRRDGVGPSAEGRAGWAERHWSGVSAARQCSSRLHLLRSLHDHQLEASGQHDPRGVDQLQACLGHLEVFRGAGHHPAVLVEPVEGGGHLRGVVG